MENEQKTMTPEEESDAYWATRWDDFGMELLDDDDDEYDPV